MFGCVTRVAMNSSEFLKIKDALKQNLTDASIAEWQKERIAEMRTRKEHGEELEDYLDVIEDEREMELDDMRHQRQGQIQTRLLEEGWTKKDMEFSRHSLAQWTKLVWQPKLITDRTWANLYPKLLPFLKANRSHNERVDKANRRRERIKKLKEISERTRLALPPLVHLTLKVPPENNKPTETSTSTCVYPPSKSDYPAMKIDQPFPTMSEFLTWSMIKNIVDDETPLEDVQTRFKEIRGGFDQAVVEWRDKIERDLIEVWHAGQDGDEEVESKVSKRKGKGKAIAQTTKSNTRKTRRSAAAANKSIPQPTPHQIELILPEFVATYTKPDGTTTTNLSDLSPHL
ncbi:hypothetical protein B0J17DRAFT_632894 [Rhizoctonia solani]|nr:hypothetical protein B0J17DRAFT_632894 [Rhizoctonia solani]